MFAIIYLPGQQLILARWTLGFSVTNPLIIKTYRTKAKTHAGSRIRQRGVTLVETLMAMSIGVMLVTIFMPLIAATQEKTRRSVCANQLRRISQAWNFHEQSLGYYPSSGWGWRYTGDPDAGFGKNQPGGWLFDVIAFTEFSAQRNLGSGLTGTERTEARLLAHRSPIQMINCPARRPAQAYPIVRNGILAFNLENCDGGSDCMLIRTDYSANAGNVSHGDSTGRIHNGVTWDMSQVTINQIEDGLSNTLSIAEKYLNADNYKTGQDAADDQSAFTGFNRDLNGYTASSTTGTPPRPTASFLPRRDRPGLGLNWTYGSAHPTGFNAAFCDSSVRQLSYNIDFRVFWAMGGRQDGPSQ